MPFTNSTRILQVSKWQNVGLGKIIHSADLHKTMPYLGRKDEDFTHIRPYRYLIVLTYKVYYFVEDDGVYIASIWDCRQGGAAF